MCPHFHTLGVVAGMVPFYAMEEICYVYHLGWHRLMAYFEDCPAKKEDSRFEPSGRLGHSCVEFACSPCACVGFLLTQSKDMQVLFCLCVSPVIDWRLSYIETVFACCNHRRGTVTQRGNFVQKDCCNSGCQKFILASAKVGIYFGME